MSYIIRTSRGWVAGFSPTHQVIQRTDNRQDAQQFETSASAHKFLATYCDAGYGLSFPDGEVVAR